MKQTLTPIDKVVDKLKHGKVGILPTDTLYGIVGSALSKDAVRRIYSLRRRNNKKPMIILIGSVSDLETFGIELTPHIKKVLKEIWLGKVSIIMPIARHRKFLTKFSYLHRGTKTLAFRLPGKTSFGLDGLLRKTGPLVAPSANFEGEPPAKTIRAARRYFGDKADFYFDVGRLDSKPSTIIEIKDGYITILRKGAVKPSMLKFIHGSR
jgi:L-threonylcarbamoyladenylate synthase